MAINNERARTQEQEVLLQDIFNKCQGYFMKRLTSEEEAKREAYETPVVIKKPMCPETKATMQSTSFNEAK